MGGTVSSDATGSLLAHMASNGLRPKNIVWNDKPRRFPGRDQQRGGNGWYVAFPDQRGAVYGDWREPGVKYHWQLEGTEARGDQADGACRAARAEYEERRKRRAAQREANQAAAASECQRTWKEADKQVPADFPYLKKKGLTKAPMVRYAEKNGDGYMIVAMYALEDGKIQSLQWIASDGKKKFHSGARAKGGQCSIMREPFPENGKGRIYVCEGWTTGVSIHMATQDPVTIAFFAGNLKRVTVHYRKKYPNAELVVCADNDRYKANGAGKHNPGVTAARVAVRAAQAIASHATTRMAVPDFKNLDGNPTDFDDLRQSEGLGGVRKWLDPSRANSANTRAPPPSDTLLLDGASAKDLERALDHFGIEVRYDLRAHGVQYRMAEPPGNYPAATWIPIDDRLEAALQEQIQSGCVTSQNRPLAFVRPWSRLINAIVVEHQVDPFEEYLESCPPWDGKERLDRLLCDLFQASDDDKLVQWGGRYIFLAVIQRTKRPGCKLREFPVIIGAQGCGKSALLRNIFPPDHRDTWYGPNLDLGGSEKVRVESLLRRALVELSELEGIKKTTLSALKSFLTREDDGSTRLSYDRRPSNLPRRCAFVGTSNDPHCLPADPTGNTRFVAITLKGGSPVEAFLNNEVTVDGMDDPCTVRDQLWAEALHRYSEGARANLPRALYTRQSEANLAATTRPAELQNAVAGLDKAGRYTYREVAEKLELIHIRHDGTKDFSQLGRQHKRIREAMLAEGWVFKRARRGGELPYCWVHPDREAASGGTF